MVTRPAPAGQEFWLHSGKKVRSIVELLHYLEESSDTDYEKYTTGKNDFAAWIRYVHKKKNLAERFENAGTRQEAISILKKAAMNHQPKTNKNKPSQNKSGPGYKSKIKNENKKDIKEIAMGIREYKFDEIQKKEFITKEFVFGLIFGIILGLLAGGFLNALR